MGNKSSRPGPPPPPPPCFKCDCDRVMPRVIKECCEATSNGAENTFLTAVNEMLGPNASLVTDALTDNDWRTTYSGYVTNITTSNANNIEPMSGNCEKVNYCDCDSAATKVITQCNEGANTAVDTIADIIDENKDLFGGINRVATSINESSNTRQQNDAANSSINFNSWITKYLNPTRGTHIENYEDYGLYKFVRQSLESRHRAFRSTPNFARDCQNNSTQSIKLFLQEELSDLDSLYNYYITFTNDHKTLLLDRNSMTDIVSNKLAILEAIQKKIDNYKSTLHMDNRKNIYLVSNYDFYKTIYFYYIIVYYALFVLYLIFSKFISEKQYANRTILLLLFIYLITPIILSYLINLIYEGYIYYLEFYNLREDTQTYNTLIEKI